MLPMSLKNSHSLEKQHGGALAIAVFVIIVMALLAAALSRTISSSTDQSSYEVLGTRAKFAAETGLEIMLGRVFPIDPDDEIANFCETEVFQHVYFDDPTITGLQQCNTLISCRMSNPDDAGVLYYHIQAVGTCKDSFLGSSNTPNSLDYTCNTSDAFCVSRSMEVEAKSL